MRAVLTAAVIAAGTLAAGACSNGPDFTFEPGVCYFVAAPEGEAPRLEVVAREREVELQRIEKEKALEEERKNIAAVIRERVAVEKTVAQEEERIKEVREVSEAERLKQVTVLNAQAEAEQQATEIEEEEAGDPA